MGKRKTIVEKKEDSKLVENANAESITLIRELMKWEKVDLTDYDAVLARIDKYFQLMQAADSKPLVAGLSQALGIDRRRLWELSHGNRVLSATDDVMALLENVYSLLETAWEYNFANDKFRMPATGIFLGKNHFGYQDVTDLVVTPNNPMGKEADEQALKQKYIESAIE